jgi:hypothetical protein
MIGQSAPPLRDAKSYPSRTAKRHISQVSSFSPFCNETGPAAGDARGSVALRDISTIAIFHDFMFNVGCQTEEAFMRNILFGIAVLVGLLCADDAFACCSYGCCDCSCVSAKLQKLAPKLDARAKGGLQSFAVDTSASKGRKTSWTCQMQAQVAKCEKQQ